MLHKKLNSIRFLMSKNKIVIFIIIAAFVGGIVGSSFLSVPKAGAGILEDIYNSVIKGTKSLDNNQSSSSKISPTVVTDHEQAVVNAVKKASPAVVSIIISKDLPVIEQCPYNPFSDIPQEFQQFFNFGGGNQFYQPCQKGTKKQDVGGGSGFIISSDGLILTNKHVVSDSKADYTVLLNDGKKYSAKVLARHPSLDIAVVKITASNLPTVELGDSSDLQLGQTTIAIGNALGEFRNTVSVGVVSGLARNLTASDSSTGQTEKLDNVIQTSAAINPGNSGGPLLDLSGRVIGINVAMVSGAQNIGFSIPVNSVKSSVDSVKTSGKIKVAYLGIRYTMLTSDLAKKYNLNIEEGALIKGDGDGFAVETDSPAAKAGIKEGDVVVEIDGKKVNSDNSLASIIAQKLPGDKTNLKIYRDGQYLNLEVVLGERK